MIDVPARVKDALRDGRMLKNYRFNVLNDDGTVDFTIENDALVSESVKIDERMCTGNQLKFGLCEGSSLEFQYFDNPNITGRQIQAFIDVQYVDADNELQWYEIPMGFFTVDQCPMQFSTGIRKVTAYNKLRSEYLDQKANELLTNAYNELQYDAYPTLDDVLQQALDGFVISSGIYNVDFEITSSRTFHYRWTDSFGDEHEETAREYTFTSKIKVPTYYIQESPSIYQMYTEGGVRIKMIGASAFIEYLTSHYTVPDILDRGIFSIGYRSTTTTPSYYDEVLVTIAGDISNDVFTGEYVKSALSDSFSSAPADNEGYLTIYLVSPDDANATLKELAEEIIFQVEYTPPTEMGGMAVNSSTFDNWQDVTLRDLQGAVFEEMCQYGQLDRSTDLFRGVELNNSRLLPADTLYPSDTLYPMGNSVRANKSMYSKLWTDSQGVQSFRYLIITYKGLDDNNQEVEKVLQRTVNADGTTDYNMSDNWLFKNLVWSDADVGTYADAMVLKMQNVTWFPFEMWCAGLPYIETGDELEISNSEGTYTSYVLQRQLNGIQNLQDTFIDGELDIF